MRINVGIFLIALDRTDLYILKGEFSKHSSYGNYIHYILRSTGRV